MFYLLMILDHKATPAIWILPKIAHDPSLWLAPLEGLALPAEALAKAGGGFNSSSYRAER